MTHGLNLHQGSSMILLDIDEAYQTAIDDGFAMLDCPIDDQRLKQGLLDHQCGALATFEGWVRNHNNSQPVERLTYYGYEALALNQGKNLVQKAYQKFDVQKIIAMHRIGDLSLGDMAVWVGVTAAHRYPALEACQWLLDAIKAEVPVWKQEFYTNGNPPLWLSNNG